MGILLGFVDGDHPLDEWGEAKLHTE